MTSVNLLPREIKQQNRTRRQAVAVGVVGAIVVGVLVALWVLQGFRLNDVKEQVARQQAVNSQLQAQVNRLQRFEQLRQSLDQRKTLLKQTLAGTVRWSGVLRDISMQIPPRMWLTSMTGSMTAPAAETATTGAAPTATGQTVMGTISFQGDSLDTDTLAVWLTKLEQVPGWVNAWLSAATKSEVNSTDVYDFTGSIDLTDRAAGAGGVR